MQTLDVISVNLWQMLISLINLFLLFLIIKYFLFHPVKRVLEQRQTELDDMYAVAHSMEQRANEDREMWEGKLSQADDEAEEILRSATENAKQRGDKIVEEARERADGIIRVAQNEAEIERRKAADEIKREIVEVSEALTEKMLEREINTEDHRELIDSFIDKIGEEDE